MTLQLLGRHHTVRYPVGLGDVAQGMALRTLAPGEMQPYVADLGDLLASMQRTIGTVAVLIDPALGGGAVQHDDTRVALEIAAPPGSAGDRVVEIRLGLVPDGAVVWTLVQRVVGPDPSIPDDAVTLGGQVITAGFQPVELSALAPLSGGVLTTDRALAYRPPVLAQDGTVLTPGQFGTVPAGAGGGLNQTAPTTLIAAATISGHRAIMVDGAGLAVHADPSNATTYNFAGVSTGAAAQSAAVSLAEAGTTVTEPSWAWTPGRAVFVGSGGTLTQTAPSSGVLHQVGQALAATILLVQPFSPIRLS